MINCTFIIVCYNDNSNLRISLEKMSKYLSDEIKLLVIDGNSTDETLDSLREYKENFGTYFNFISEEDLGLYDAMNKGILRATGDVVGFLNSDDVFADEFAVANIAAAFTQSKAGVVFGDLVYTKEQDLTQVTRNWRLGPMPAWGMKTGWHPGHPTMYVSREIIQRDPFDLAFPIAGDYEMMVRLLEKQKLPSNYIPHTLVRMREGGASNKNLKNILKANIECLRAWSKNGLIANPLTIALKLGRKILQY